MKAPGFTIVKHGDVCDAVFNSKAESDYSSNKAAVTANCSRLFINSYTKLILLCIGYIDLHKQYLKFSHK